MTLEDSMLLRGGRDAQIAVYEALLRRGQKEPDDFSFGQPVDFVMRKVPRALAILGPDKRRAGLLELRRAAMAAQGIDVQIVDEADALTNADSLAERLVRGG